MQRENRISSESSLNPQTWLLTASSGFLESLCDNLYDHLRPRILHEPSLETLCGVCTVLQALMVQDVSSIEEEPEIISSPVSTPAYSPFATTPNGFTGDDYFSAADETYSARQRRTGSVRHNSYSGSILGRPERERMNSGKVKQRKQLGRLHTEVLLRLVLQDAQTRLVFRAQALLRAEVEFYVPKEGDLDYPAKIQGELIGPRTLADSHRQEGATCRAAKQHLPRCGGR